MTGSDPNVSETDLLWMILLANLPGIDLVYIQEWVRLFLGVLTTLLADFSSQ
jgi:hypothetical protein